VQRQEGIDLDRWQAVLIDPQFAVLSGGRGAFFVLFGAVFLLWVPPVFLNFY
jgi:hypothetical protein